MSESKVKAARPKLPDVMIDIETLGKSPDAAIISIGAVMFDPRTGALGDEFHMKVSFEEAVTNGRADLDTLRWWITQPAEAGIAVTAGTASNLEVLSEFIKFLNAHGNPNPWGNGATFDIVILESAFKRIEQAPPWEHWQHRDCRTMEYAAEGICDRDEFTRDGLHHDALEDAKFQAKYISGMYRALNSASRKEKTESAA